MPARSEERTNARKEEIINACEMLYQTMNFKDITIKEIGNVTSFSRTSIYNYFETKEEIFLALLKENTMRGFWIYIRLLKNMKAWTMSRLHRRLQNLWIGVINF